MNTGISADWSRGIPATPADTLAQLADDEDEWVRQAVAENPNTPADTLIDGLLQFANSSYTLLRETAAKHLNTPADILSILARDEDKSVRRDVATESPALQPTPSPNSPTTKTNGYAKRSRRIPHPSRHLAQLADDEDGRVRWRVAGNPNTPKRTGHHSWR